MASVLSKFANAVKGLKLTSQHLKVLDMDVFRDKRVAVVGPATSAYNTGRGRYIDGFDIVIRINKAPQLLALGKGTDDIGRKTDILFHSFFENDFSGGGALDFPLFDKLKIRYVVNPIPTFFGYRLNFNFYKKYLDRRATYILPRSFYRGIPAQFGKFRPTTGYCALKAVLDSDFKEFYITGFTFFKTAYTDGYRDAMKEASQAQKHIKSAKIHDPELEYEGFKMLLKKNEHKFVVVDESLRDILLNDAAFGKAMSVPEQGSRTGNERS